MSVGNVGQANYSAAKAGVLGLTRTAAHEVDQYDVRVDAAWPAALTRMTEDLPAMSGVGPDHLGLRHAAVLPTVLASDEAAGVTGCTIAVAGDTVAFVSDPERERTPSTDAGGWTAAELADRWDDLTEGYETARLSSGY